MIQHHNSKVLYYYPYERIITKKDCSRCIELKDWMKENELPYVEKDIDDEEFVHQLLHDENFVGMFCDAEGCVVNTSVVRYKGKYIFKYFF